MNASVKRRYNRPDRACSPDTLRSENRAFRGTAGISKNNRAQGFVPGFMDLSTGRIYRSRFKDGSPAPVHSLDGLPDTLVLTWGSDGGVTAVKSTVISGFLMGGRFLTRAEAAKAAI
jgi:hypothetical protein